MLNQTTIQMLLSKIEAAHREGDAKGIDSLFVHAYSLCNASAGDLSVVFEFLVSKLDIAHKTSDTAKFAKLFDAGLKWATATDTMKQEARAELFLAGAA